MTDREPFRLVVEAEQAGQRLDLYLAAAVPDLSRTQAQRLIAAGDALVDGERARPAHELRAGQCVTCRFPPPAPDELLPEAIPLDVVYEDAHLLVIDKPAGMVTHPARGHPGGTLVNALLAHCHDLSGIGGVYRPGIVHRLDRFTSGLIVVAKHDTAHQALSEQLKARTAGRVYLALAYGDPEFDQTMVDAAIGRHRGDRQRMAVEESGRPARTRLTCLERFGLAALLRANLESGRTHQVRVHCAWLGHPLFADPLYGRRRQAAFAPLPPEVQAAVEALPGQALHAAELSFRHPADGRDCHFSVPPPQAFATLLSALRALPRA